MIRQNFRQRFSNGKKRRTRNRECKYGKLFHWRKIRKEGKNEIWIGKKDKWTGGKNL